MREDRGEDRGGERDIKGERRRAGERGGTYFFPMAAVMDVYVKRSVTRNKSDTARNLDTDTRNEIMS
jgi:hypothetical protein